MSELTLVQLTDTHIRAAGERVLDSVDTHAVLLGVLERLRGGGRRIDALILSGDLTDNGAPEAYRRLRDAVEPAAAELGAQVLLVMGNHDERGAFGVELLGLEPDAPGSRDRVLEVDGLRVIGLDSTTPGRHDGRLEPEQLAWLGEQLRRPAERGTLLVLHHPPLPSAIPAAEFLKLQDADRLAEVLAGSDVRMILCGHNHMTAAAALAGIPVWVGPALAYRIDAMAPAGRQQAYAGAGFTRLDVLGETVIATAVDAIPVHRIYDKSETEVQERLSALAADAG
ncbi:metallophosphoesterase [Nocardia seriolae]|uniref:3',5'-cyclic adenosine monophosphate phosphodiesterase CpdA n=1 Tax=Nocardia seriolae TaxID=37332 RepID=A0A0B8MZU8_9NOCA|nr:metallophosphoesterase [Nocardia seriolae]APA99351.1 3',5'-cyclic adenosine monophosphate phosphodiesterase CpdA [Nocardia seriolae]MTJ63260.1 metallophosphatase [Nocardia seriolae]MTJ72197.1 metallophosphatase [Nocardia seriolae]MTJ88939.1 metallophosphatase [Nocardia seriolae]MTK32917.1 metallophosphatase [Nocardia seriolae]